jgi:hypothetical protein
MHKKYIIRPKEVLDEKTLFVRGQTIIFGLAYNSSKMVTYLRKIYIHWSKGGRGSGLRIVCNA